MSVYKPAKGRFWHYDFVYQGRRCYGSTGVMTRSKAEKVEQAKREAVAKGAELRPVREILTLGQAATMWWENKADKKTAGQLLRRVNLAVDLVGRSKPVNEVFQSDIDAAIRKRRGMLVKDAQGVSRPPANATVNRDIIATIRPTLKLQDELLNDGKGQPVPFPKINWKRLRLEEPKPRPRNLHAGDIEATIVELPPHMLDFERFQRRYGPRLEEMFFHPEDLEIWEDETGEKHARVLLRERKAGDDHIIPVADDDVPWLAARKGRAVAAGLDTIWWRPPRPAEMKNRDPKRRIKPDALVPLTYTAAGRAIGRAMERAGVKGKRGIRGSHNYRHTAGMTLLRDSKGNLRAVQKLLGHANLQSTLTYAHVLEDDLRDLLNQQSRPAHEPETQGATDEAVKRRRSKN